MLKSKDSGHLVFLVFVLSLILVFAITSVNAIEINGTDDVITSNLENVEEKPLGVASITPSGNTFWDIQMAVNNINDGGTVILDKELYVGNGAPICISKSINIIGKDGIMPVLDANGKSRIFAIEEGSTKMLIQNCEFIRGKAIEGGGAIVLYGQNIEIKDCIFRDNEARGGGAIGTAYAPKNHEAENLKIINCKFYNNLAYICAGAVAAYGNNTLISSCVFDSNKAYNKDHLNSEVFGGALQLGNPLWDNNATCIDCLFINNSAISTVAGYSSHAGAGCIREGVNYISCTFISNSADYGGAVVYHAYGNIKNCIFLNNTAHEYGGALNTGFSDFQWDLVIENSDFKGNKASFGGACSLFGNNLKFDNCSFVENYANIKGGAIFTNGNTITIQNSVINNNLANVAGGGVYINSTMVSIMNSEFNYNDVIPMMMNMDDGLGGAIYIKSSQTSINSNTFKYNTARNGSAIYIDKLVDKIDINNNEMYENQAWVYSLPIVVSKNTILFNQPITISSSIHGGNNIGKYLDLANSNAIYNDAGTSSLKLDGSIPVLGATDSGRLYQDDREYNTNILITVVHEDGTVVYNNSLSSNVYGEVGITLNDLKVGNYNVIATHFEDNYYKEIVNSTMFTVLPQADVTISKIKEYPSYNYKDYMMWNVTVTNKGPNKATGIVLRDILPEGLIFIDSNNGEYNPNTGILNISEIDVSESISLIIITQINKTGKIINNANVSANEYDADLSNNNDVEFLIVNPAADLCIIETVSDKNPNFGDVISLKIITTNNGPDDATEVKVFDCLPEGLVWLNDDSNGEYNPNTGIWNLDILNKNQSKVLTIVCKVNKTGKLVNNVSVSSKEYDWNLSNNNASEFIEVSKAADLEITKTVDNSNPNYLDAIKWTITVKNNGPDKATGVIVKETVPDGLVMLVHSGEDSFDGNIWNVGDLANGETKELFIYCRVNKTGNFVNFASVKSNEYDPDGENNNDSSTIVVAPASDLKIIKSVNNKTPNFQDVIHWIIEVKNNGPDMATDVIVRDIIPDGLIYVESTSSKGNYNIGDGLWTISFIPTFSSEFLDIYCKVNKTGVITNNVSVEVKEYDYDESNNKASEFIVVEKTIDLAIEFILNNKNPNYNDIISIDIVAKNNGPDDATGVKAFNMVPDGFILINNNQNSELKNGVWDIGNLASGESKYLHLSCKVNKTGFINHYVSISGNEFDINLDNNHDSKLINIDPSADLEISKTASKIEYSPGDFIDYTVKVTNKGPNTAHNIKVEEFLDENMTFISYYADMGDFSNDGRFWSVEELEVDQSAILKFRTIANKVGEVLNKVSVTCDEYDYLNENNFAELKVLVKDSVDLIKNSSNHNVSQKMNQVKALEHSLELKKTGSPVMILVMALCILLSFGSGYFQKK